MVRPPVRFIDIMDAIYEGREVFFQYVSIVSDLMSPVKSLDTNATVQDGVTFLEQHDVHHIVIVEEEVLVGIVSQRDIARYAWSGGDDDRMEELLVGLATRPAKTVQRSASLGDLTEFFLNKRIDAAPVLDGEDLVGIITTTDLVRCFARFEVLRRARPDDLSFTSQDKDMSIADVMMGKGGQTPSEFLVGQVFSSVGDIMTKDVESLTDDSSISDAIEMMIRVKCRHVPVLDENWQITGIVSDRDILARLPPLPKGFMGGDGDGVRDKLFYIDKSEETKAALAIPLSAIIRSCATVEISAPVHDVLVGAFCRDGIEAVPVVASDDSSLVGIVTQYDGLKMIRALLRMV